MGIAKRFFDIVFSIVALTVAAPFLLLASIIVLAVDFGPVFYKAKRSGLNGDLFTMYKVRTMRREQGQNAGKITAFKDKRVLPGAGLIRALKIDELPQFWNVLKGDMSVVGPRPEDPEIVKTGYTDYDLRTLSVRPGLASPGSLYGTVHYEALAGADADRIYMEEFLPLKLSLEQVYVDRVGVPYDLAIIGRTVVLILQVMAGRKQFPDPPEMPEAKRHLAIRNAAVQKQRSESVQIQP